MKLLLSLSVLIVMFSILFFSLNHQRRELRENGQEAKAVITWLNHKYVDYVFTDGISVYKRIRKQVGYKFYKKHSVGDTILVIYSTIDPNINTIK